MDELERLEYRIAKLEKTVMYLTQIIMNYDVAKNVNDLQALSNIAAGDFFDYQGNDISAEFLDGDYILKGDTYVL